MILNAETDVGLSLIRSFGRRGVYVVAGGDRHLARAFYSRYCKKSFVYPDSRHTDEEIHKVILKYVLKFRPDVVIPAGTDTTAIAVRFKAVYSRYTKLVPLLDWPKYLSICDKWVQMRLAKKHKVPIPRTWCPRNESALNKLKDRLPYPVLIKPRLSRNCRGIRFVESAASLITAYKEVAGCSSHDRFTDCSSPLIQEFLPIHSKGLLFHYNDLYRGVYVLFRDNRLAASYVHTSLRIHTALPDKYFPRMISTPIKDDKIVGLTASFLQKIGWEGMAAVQFYIDPRDNIAKLIEINPRVPAGVESAMRAGIDFPYLWYQLAMGEPVKKQTDYRCDGIKFRWICFAEAYSLLKSKKKVKFLRELFDGKTNYEFSFADIMPHIAHFFCYVLYGMGR